MGFASEDALSRLLTGSLVLVGSAYGANWAIMPSVMASRFGSENVGCCFNITASLMSVTVLLTAFAGGVLYDDAAVGHTSADGASSASAHKDGPLLCKGASCWRSAYSLGIFLSTAGLLGASIGAHRAWRRQQDLQ